jgi:TetR/AcrR family transcriptional regulator, transcriptional repressor for nem operon
VKGQRLSQSKVRVAAARCLRQYPDIFRKSLEADNRMCLCSFMAAEYDDLPEAVKREVKLSPMSTWRGSARCCPLRQWSIPGRANSGRAIFAVVAGAQLMARSRSDILLFDSLIDSYRVAGLLPA